MDDNEIITKDELEKFKEIARKDYEVKLTDEQAFKHGAELVSLFESLIKNQIKK